MVNEYEIKKQICDIGRRIYSRNMVAANDGNISVKLNDNEFLCTPTGVSKGFMTPEYICKVDREGNVIQANPGFKPSSEIKMHMRVYEKRPDVGSVVHAHPIYATSFAIAGIPLTQPIMPEAVISLGCVPIAEYGTPSTMEIPEAMIKTQCENMVNEFAQRLAQSGLSMEQYMQFSGLTLDKLEEQVRPEAETRIKSSLVLEQIAKDENIEVSEEEIDAEIEKMAKAYGMEADKLKEYMGDAEKESMKRDISVTKAVDLVMENVKERAKAKTKKDKEAEAEENAEE